MLNLKDPKLSYLVASTNDASSLSSYLYSRDYYILDIQSYHKGQFEKSFIAFTNLPNDEIRRDAIHLMEYFSQESLVVKYRDEVAPKRIYENGGEHPLGVLMYNTDSDNKSYIYDGVSFSFIEQQLYYFPKKREDFKSGMVVEFFSNNKWIEKKVVNPDSEFDKMYGLLMKYNKIRIPV